MENLSARSASMLSDHLNSKWKACRSVPANRERHHVMHHVLMVSPVPFFCVHDRPMITAGEPRSIHYHLVAKPDICEPSQPDCSSPCRYCYDIGQRTVTMMGYFSK